MFINRFLYRFHSNVVSHSLIRIVAAGPTQQLLGTQVVPAAAAAASAAAARYHSSTAASSSSSSSAMKPGAAFLASLVDYEKVGVPAASGVAGSSSSSSSSSSFDLAKMHSLLHALGDPHKQLKVVHVAGTKGKGSVVTLLSNILTRSGYKVGTYTSPHLFDILERILVGAGSGESAAAAAVTEQQWKDLAQQAAAAAQNMTTLNPSSSSSSSSPSHFEVVTAMAFKHFSDSKVDIAVIETGLGGATDATNVWNENNTDNQLQLSIITSIGRDHLDALGGSISSITRAKAGIMKAGVPVVVGPQGLGQSQQQQQQQQQQRSDSDVVWEVLHEVSADLACPMFEAQQMLQVTPVSGTPAITILPGQGTALAQQTLDITAPLLPPQQQQLLPATATAAVDLRSVSVRLVGDHQIGNIQTAVAAALLLHQRGWCKITDESIQQGLEAAWLPGRFQVVQLPDTPYHIVLDGAHTADSAAALAAAVRAAFPDQPLVLLLAMAADKQHREVCEALRACRPSVVIFTSVPIAGSHHRSAPPGTLAAHWQAAAVLSSSSSSSSRPFRCRELIQASLGAALEKAGHELSGFGGNGVVLVTGSLHAVAAAMKQLDIAPHTV